MSHPGVSHFVKLERNKSKLVHVLVNRLMHQWMLGPMGWGREGKGGGKLDKPDFPVIPKSPSQSHMAYPPGTLSFELVT